MDKTLDLANYVGHRVRLLSGIDSSDLPGGEILEGRASGALVRWDGDGKVTWINAEALDVKVGGQWIRVATGDVSDRHLWRDRV